MMRDIAFASAQEEPDELDLFDQQIKAEAQADIKSSVKRAKHLITSGLAFRKQPKGGTSLPVRQNRQAGFG